MEYKQDQSKAVSHFLMNFYAEVSTLEWASEFPGPTN